MCSVNELKTKICEAFANVEYPGDWCLRAGGGGDEPFLLESEFKGKSDWTCLDASFLDQAPGGYGSALSFFSDEAFRYYLPAYLIADVDCRLELANVGFHLTRGLTDSEMVELSNPQRYGARTLFDEARYKFSMFKSGEAAAITAFLRHKHELFENDETRCVHSQKRIAQALRNYWLNRAML